MKFIISTRATLKNEAHFWGKQTQNVQRKLHVRFSFQGRIGGIKGMFVVDDSLEGIKVQHRPSMLKYQASGISSSELHNTVEIKQWDAPPPSGSLCQTSIQMLEERDLAQKEIDELKSLRDDPELLLRKYKASKYLKDGPNLIDDDILMRMLHANIPLDEPVMILKTNDFINRELKTLREKVSDSHTVYTAQFIKIFTHASSLPFLLKE